MTIPIYAFQPRMVSWLLFITAFTPLAAALIAQYGFGYPPCELCMYQRYPYVLVCLFALIGVAKPAMARPLIAASCVALLTTAGIGFFHVGVEQDWWQYDSACSSVASGDGSLTSLRAAILDAPLVSCKQSTFAFLNLSMAAWNVLSGLGLAVLFGYLLAITKRMQRS